MRKNFYIMGALFMVFSLMLGACQPAAQPTPETIVQTVIVEGEVQEIVVTATPVPVVEEVVEPVTAPFKNPDTLMVITGAGEPETLDPAWTYETAGSTTELNIYEGLAFFKRESTTEYVPALATDWTTSEDGKQWVFNIRDGVKFHKGGTLEPHDIAYTVARASLQGRIDGWQWITYEAFFGTDYSLASSKDFAAAYAGKATFEELTPDDLLKVCEAVKAAVVADDAAGTVTYNLAAPVPWFLALASQQFLGGVLDQEWMAENGDWDGDCATWQNFADPAAEDTILFKDANGTGPYMLESWIPNEEIILTANPDYWRTEPMWEGGPSGVARIPRVVIKNVDEWGTRLSMFQAGDADFIYAPAQYRAQLEPYYKQRCGIDESSCVDENAEGYIKAFRSLPSPAIRPSRRQSARCATDSRWSLSSDP